MCNIMTMKIHRDIKDIPAKSADDPDLYGFDDTYDYEKTPEKRAFSYAKKKMYQSNATEQISHFDGEHLHIISVTSAQARCYNVVKSQCQNNNEGHDLEILKMLYRYATINVLVKKNLLKVVGERVFVGTRLRSDIEIMEKGGVGKISITMPA